MRAQELHRKYGPTADYKPLHHGTLHAGSLSPPVLASSAAPKPLDPNTKSSVEDDPSYTALVAAHDEMVQDYNLRKGEKLTGEICDICQTPLYSDPGPQELCIYLHALAYADVEGEWRYTSPMPNWTRPPDAAEDDEVMPSPQWDYAALGKDAMMVDLEAEEKEGRRRNKKGMVTNREIEADDG